MGEFGFVFGPEPIGQGAGVHVGGVSICEGEFVPLRVPRLERLGDIHVDSRGPRQHFVLRPKWMSGWRLDGRTISDEVL